MNIFTRREFSWVNPQDDPDLYPILPQGFQYDVYGNITYERLPNVAQRGGHISSMIIPIRVYSDHNKYFEDIGTISITKSSSRGGAASRTRSTSGTSFDTILNKINKVLAKNDL